MTALELKRMLECVPDDALIRLTTEREQNPFNDYYSVCDAYVLSPRYADVPDSFYLVGE